MFSSINYFFSRKHFSQKFPQLVCFHIALVFRKKESLTGRYVKIDTAFYPVYLVNMFPTEAESAALTGMTMVIPSGAVVMDMV